MRRQTVWLLEEEYGKESLTRKEYEGHAFNETSMEWQKTWYDDNISEKPSTKSSSSVRSRV